MFNLTFQIAVVAGVFIRDESRILSRNCLKHISFLFSCGTRGGPGRVEGAADLLTNPHSIAQVEDHTKDRAWLSASH